MISKKQIAIVKDFVKRRKLLGKTQGDVAIGTGLSFQIVQKLEQNKTNATMNTMDKYERWLEKEERKVK